jgi:hypothetical protein
MQYMTARVASQEAQPHSLLLDTASMPSHLLFVLLRRHLGRQPKSQLGCLQCWHYLACRRCTSTGGKATCGCVVCFVDVILLNLLL